MKLNTIATLSILSFCSIFHITGMEITPHKQSKKQRKIAKQEEEEDTIVAQWTKTIEAAWNNFDNNARIKLPIDTYIQIQKLFSPSAKELITQAPQIKLTEKEKEAFSHLGKEKEIRENLHKKLEEYQAAILKNQELKKIIKKHEDNIAELKAEQKKITTARKRARQKAKKQQSLLLNTSSNKFKNEQLTFQQVTNKKRLVALRTLFKKYNVQKEADLKNKFNDICWQTNENCFEDKINNSCTFEYYSDTNELHIFTDAYDSEFEASNSSNHLKTNATMIPQ